MVSALDSGSSGPRSCAGRGHCVGFLGKTLVGFFTKCCAGGAIKVPDMSLYSGRCTCDGLVSHPGGVAILLVGFMLLKWKPELSADLISLI